MPLKKVIDLVIYKKMRVSLLAEVSHDEVIFASSWENSASREDACRLINPKYYAAHDALPSPAGG